MVNGDFLKFPKVLPNRNDYGDDFPKDCVFTHLEAIISLGKYGVLDRSKTYLEPACGTGNLSSVLELNGYSIDSSDKLDWGYGKIMSIERHEPQSVDVVLTNPPYSIWELFLQECLRIARTDVFLLFPLRYLEGQHRSQVFNNTGLSRVYVFTYRVKMYSADGSRLSGMTAYAWYHWQRPHRRGSESLVQLHWLDR